MKECFTCRKRQQRNAFDGRSTNGYRAQQEEQRKAVEASVIQLTAQVQAATQTPVAGSSTTLNNCRNSAAAQFK